MTSETIAGLFDGFADSDDPFLVYDDGYRAHAHTYRETADAARVFALRLSAHGIAKGDSVLFYGENRPEWIAAFWGCVLIGAVVVPVDYRASADLLSRVLAIAKGKLLLFGDEVSLPPNMGVPVWPF
ncbi:MAG TPA: class I adenylate-forming enzyme family protein, partial [Bryobacteraceae bacterium]|nr:class I adenylate-forming enzyme family protein [Bryobacteraceae bacterium]